MIFGRKNKWRESKCKNCNYGLLYFGTKVVDDNYVPYIKNEISILYGCPVCRC